MRRHIRRLAPPRPTCGGKRMKWSVAGPFIPLTKSLCWSARGVMQRAGDSTTRPIRTLAYRLLSAQDFSERSCTHAKVFSWFPTSCHPLAALVTLAITFRSKPPSTVTMDTTSPLVITFPSAGTAWSPTPVRCALAPMSSLARMSTSTQTAALQTSGAATETRLRSRASPSLSRMTSGLRQTWSCCLVSRSEGGRRLRLDRSFRGWVLSPGQFNAKRRECQLLTILLRTLPLTASTSDGNQICTEAFPLNDGWHLFYLLSWLQGSTDSSNQRI